MRILLFFTILVISPFSQYAHNDYFENFPGRFSRSFYQDYIKSIWGHEIIVENAELLNAISFTPYFRKLSSIFTALAFPQIRETFKYFLLLRLEMLSALLYSLEGNPYESLLTTLVEIESKEAFRKRFYSFILPHWGFEITKMQQCYHEYCKEVLLAHYCKKIEGILSNYNFYSVLSSKEKIVEEAQFHHMFLLLIKEEYEPSRSIHLTRPSSFSCVLLMNEKKLSSHLL